MFVVDVRTVPRSRINPQYNRETLPQSLEPFEIGYEHIASLGGLRGRARGDLERWPTGLFVTSPVQLNMISRHSVTLNSSLTFLARPGAASNIPDWRSRLRLKPLSCSLRRLSERRLINWKMTHSISSKVDRRCSRTKTKNPISACARQSSPT